MALTCLISIMFSGGTGPTYWIVHDVLGLRDEVAPLAVILTECTMGMYMILGGMAFRSVPEETVEAARIDGCGHFKVMFRVMLPQCMSMFMITVLFTFVASWNSFIGAQLYITDPNLFPLQLVLEQLKNDVNGWMTSSANPDYAKYTIQFAGIVIATLPIMIIMPFFQDEIESGIIGGAVKG